MNQDFSSLNTSSGQQQPGISGLPGFSGVQPATPAGSTAQATGVPTKDSIEKAGALAAALNLIPLMSNNPILNAPDPNMIGMISQLAMDKICLNILDSWSKNLQEIADQKKEDEKKIEANPILREMYVTASVFLAVATIFLRAIFGTQVAEAFQSGGAHNDQLIAQKFASQLTQWALDGTLNGYLMTVVDQMPSSATMSEGQKGVLVNEIQVMLLSSGLAAVYKSQTHWLTSEEFINLLANPGILNDPNANLLSMLIVNTLSELPVDARTRMARTLTIYMNSNPDLPTLFDLGQSTAIQNSILNGSRT
jgi:hypothetical protein